MKLAEENCFQGTKRSGRGGGHSIVTVRVLLISSLGFVLAFRLLSFPCPPLPTPAWPQSNMRDTCDFFRTKKGSKVSPSKGDTHTSGHRCHCS